MAANTLYTFDIRLHTENQLLRNYGSCLKVTVGWWWVLTNHEPITLSLQLELCLVELGCDNNYLIQSLLLFKIILEHVRIHYKSQINLNNLKLLMFQTGILKK